MEWQHGREFMCVAFQNKVAHAMDGYTLHSAGEVRVGQQNYEALLECRDIDSLYTRIEANRWLIFDESFMNPDDLLGSFAHNIQQAAPQQNRYYQRENKELRIFGGFNFLMFGDTRQLPPLPESSALFIPPCGKTSVTAHEILDFLWSNKADFLIFQRTHYSESRQ